jgi:hypothetical protein
MRVMAIFRSENERRAASVNAPRRAGDQPGRNVAIRPID